MAEFRSGFGSAPAPLGGGAKPSSPWWGGVKGFRQLRVLLISVTGNLDPLATYSWGMVWIPFSKRQTEEDVKAYLELREGIPDGVCTAMLQFVISLLYEPSISMSMVIKRDLGSEFHRATDHPLPQDADTAYRYLWQDRDLLIDVCDFAANSIPFGDYRSVQRVEEFNQHLIQARSIYIVRPNGSGAYALQRRVGSEVLQTLEGMASKSDAGSQLMTRAWNKAFGRVQDNSGACLDAIRALEVVARPIFSPDDDEATLGKIISAYRDKPTKWTSTISDPEFANLIVASLELLWRNHPRHGSDEEKYSLSASSTHHFLMTALWLFETLHNGAVSMR